MNGHRRATLRDCGDCGQPLLTGWDDWICALAARADTRPINTPTEIQAITADLRTYELRQGRLHRRTTSNLRTNPATSSPWPVLVQHACDFPIPTWHRPTTSSSLLPPDHATSEPPF